MAQSRKTRLFRDAGLWLVILGLYLYGLFDLSVFGGFVMGAGAMLIAQYDDVLQPYTSAAFNYLSSWEIGASKQASRKDPQIDAGSAS